VILLIMRQSAYLTIAGIGGGLVLGFAIAESAKSLLFGVHPTNLRVYISTAFLLFLISLFSAYVPARRASRLSPMNALRYE
jgi:putative ABC transport system permease protein